MSLRSRVSAARRWLRRYWSRRVLAGWLVLTALVAGNAYVSVAPALEGVADLQLAPLPPVPVGFLGLVAAGLAFAQWSDRPRAALGAAGFVGVGALSLPGGCDAGPCPGVERFHVFLDWQVLGPAASVSHGAPPCAYQCPHTVELVPLAVGYLLVGEILRPAASPAVLPRERDG